MSRDMRILIKPYKIMTSFTHHIYLSRSAGEIYLLIDFIEYIKETVMRVQPYLHISLFHPACRLMYTCASIHVLI